jgi:hypothetical protein
MPWICFITPSACASVIIGLLRHDFKMPASLVA